MEEKLQQIIDKYEDKIFNQEEFIKILEARLEFCGQHNLDEEKRITHVRLDMITMVVFRWRNMQNEIQELLNKWNS